MNFNEFLERNAKLKELKNKIDMLKGLLQTAQSAQIFQATAIIIEPRRHKALEFVLRNILENLKEEWGVQVYHGNLNEEYLKNLIQTKLSQYSLRITLINLNVDNLTPKEYSSILLDKNFISKIPTETFLIFQTDSMINPRYKDLLYVFLQYDYVGAPWAAWASGGIGNGGFSLRRRSKCLECIQNVPPNIDYEDKWYSSPMHKMNKPTYELAVLFSMETVYSKVFFGVHNAWNYHSSKAVEEMCENCPGLSELISLQGVY